MPAAYLTATDAKTRLSRHSIVGSPSQADLEIASDDLDLSGRFIGVRNTEAQLREFPRSVTVRDDAPGAVPGRVLDWIALRAYQLSEDDDAPVLSEKVSSISVSYARAKESRVERLMQNLLRHYLASAGGRRAPARIV